MNKNKHLSYEERKTIAERLTERASFKAISSELGRDCTTISKEVKKHITKAQTGAMGKPFNNCLYRFSCKESSLCTECTYRRSVKNCRFCNKCHTICKKYKPTTCEKLKNHLMYVTAVPISILNAPWKNIYTFLKMHKTNMNTLFTRQELVSILQKRK